MNSRFLLARNEVFKTGCGEYDIAQTVLAGTKNFMVGK